MPRSRFLSSLAFLLGLSVIGAAQTPSFRVGEPVPHIHLPDVRTLSPVDLDEFQGKKVLLAEFASW